MKLEKSVKLPDHVQVNKINDFETDKGDILILLACNDSLLLTCSVDVMNYDEIRLTNVGDIIDLNQTSKTSEFLLITKEGLKFCNMTSYSVTLNKNEEYFKYKKVAGAFEYQPNIFIVALDKE